MLHRRGAQAAPQLAVIALGEQVQIGVAQQRAEGIGVFGFLHAARPVNAQAIALRLGQRQFEQPVRVAAVHASQRRAVTGQQVHRIGTWQPGPYQGFVALRVRAEEAERIAVLGALQSLHSVLIQVRTPGN